MEPDFWGFCKQEGWVAALTSYLLRLCAHQAPGTQRPPRQRQQELSLHLRWCPVPDPWGHPQSPQRGKGGAASGILGKPFCGHRGAQSPQPGSHDLPGPQRHLPLPACICDFADGFMVSSSTGWQTFCVHASSSPGQPFAFLCENSGEPLTAQLQ